MYPQLSGRRFESRLRWFEAEYAFAPLALDRARVELLGGVRFFHYEGLARARVQGLPAPLEAEVEEDGPVPHGSPLKDGVVMRK